MYYLFIDGAHKIFEDSSSLGWGYVITDSNFNILEEEYGKPRKSANTSIQCELEALYQGLKRVYESSKYVDKSICIYTDNESIYDGIKGFSRRSSNREYWIGIENLFKKMIGRLNINHVKSHQPGENNIIKLNRRVDRLANIGANSLLIGPVEI